MWSNFLLAKSTRFQDSIYRFAALYLFSFSSDRYLDVKGDFRGGDVLLKMAHRSGTRLSHRNNHIKTNNKCK